MPGIFSARDLELFGYSKISEKTKLLSEKDHPWMVFSATALAGVSSVTHTIAYLPSSCTRDQAERLSRLVRVASDFFLIVQKSGLAKETLLGIFGREAQIAVYEDLIWDKLQSIFSEYVESLKQNIPTEEYYVTPRSEGSRGPRDRLDDIIIDYLRGDKKDVGYIKVVSASAGVGKTTLTRVVVKRLAEATSIYRVIPTYVEAHHWSKLPLESVDDLWAIILNSLNVYGARLTITEDLFKHALKQGYLVFVFDGFDELCGQRHSQFNTREALQWLIEIVKEADARIVITTRTLFWEAEVGTTPECTSLLKLRPFEAPQARDYFHKFFPGDKPSADRALGLYKQLIRQSQRPRETGGGRVQFANLPLCVELIARYVKEGGTTLAIEGEHTIIEQFLEEILKREQGRQNLKTTAKNQLIAFEEVAVELNQEFDLKLLEAAGFAEEDINKLKVHPLLTTTDKGDYRFSYAFLESYLQASYLVKVISQLDISKSTVWGIMVREANGKSYVIEHLVELLGPESLQKVGEYYSIVPVQKKFQEVKSFLFHVAKMMVEDVSGLTMKERSMELFSILGRNDYVQNRVIKDIHVIGNLDRLDLSDTTVEKSVFHNTTFTKCAVNHNTNFVRCRFSGELIFQDCDEESWRQVKLHSCELETPTNLIWEGVLHKEISTDEDYISDALVLALSKFWRYGSFKGSIKKQDWHRGTLGHSIYCKPIIEEMLRVGLVSEAHISGVQEGGYAFARDAISDLQHFMDNRKMTGKIKKVYEALRKKRVPS